MKRKAFMKSILGASAFLGFPISKIEAENNSIQELIDKTKRDNNGSMFGFKCSKIEKVRIGIIGLGNRGNTLLEMLEYLIKNNHAEINGLSDLTYKKVNLASEKISSWQRKKIKLFYNSKDNWKKMCQRDDIDLIIIATPWKLHARFKYW